MQIIIKYTTEEINPQITLLINNFIPSVCPPPHTHILKTFSQKAKLAGQEELRTARR